MLDDLFPLCGELEFLEALCWALVFLLSFAPEPAPLVYILNPILLPLSVAFVIKQRLCYYLSRGLHFNTNDMTTSCIYSSIL